MDIVRRVITAIAGVDRGIPVAEIATLAEETNRGLTRELLVGRLAAIFGLLNLMIAGLGLYGVLAFQVGQRRTEIGVRMALGASSAVIVQMILTQASLICFLGCALGVTLSLFASSLVRSLLFGIAQLDLWTYTWSLSILVMVSMTAAMLPAWRAATIDPATTLRAN